MDGKSLQKMAKKIMSSAKAGRHSDPYFYNGLDVLTIMSTEKGIKSHIYTNVKELYEHSKFGE